MKNLNPMSNEIMDRTYVAKYFKMAMKQYSLLRIRKDK